MSKLRSPLDCFAGAAPSYKAARTVMEEAGVQENEVEVLVHRQGLYPGNYWITCKDGRTVNADAQKMIGFGGILFMDSNRCLTCNDLLCELSDLSVSDVIRQDLIGAPYPVLNQGETPKFGQEAWSYGANASAAISKDAKNPKLAAQVLDYAYSKAGDLLYNYGTEGKSYTLLLFRYQAGYRGYYDVFGCRYLEFLIHSSHFPDEAGIIPIAVGVT
jgi:hypothetical protein